MKKKIFCPYKMGGICKGVKNCFDCCIRFCCCSYLQSHYCHHCKVFDCGQEPHSITDNERQRRIRVVSPEVNKNV